MSEGRVASTFQYVAPGDRSPGARGERRAADAGMKSSFEEKLTREARLSDRANDGKAADAERKERFAGRAREAASGGSEAARTGLSGYGAGAARGAGSAIPGRAGGGSSGMTGESWTPMELMGQPSATSPTASAAQGQQAAAAAEARGASTAQQASMVSELIESRIRRMLASAGARRGEVGARVSLSMKDGPLEGTELWLERTEDGWRLDVHGSDARTAAEIERAAPELSERFERDGLGPLAVWTDGGDE